MIRAGQAPQIHETAVRMELANRMVGQPAVAQESLESFFTGVMNGLENYANQTFAPSLRQRVWERVSPEHLKSLKGFFLLEFSDKILGDFRNDEVKAMLAEHERNGVITNALYNGIISGAYHFNRKTIIDSVVEQANAMIISMIPEIAKAVADEGVKMIIPGHLTV